MFAPSTLKKTPNIWLRWFTNSPPGRLISSQIWWWPIRQDHIIWPERLQCCRRYVLFWYSTTFPSRPELCIGIQTRLIDTNTLASHRITSYPALPREPTAVPGLLLATERTRIYNTHRQPTHFVTQSHTQRTHPPVAAIFQRQRWSRPLWWTRWAGPPSREQPVHCCCYWDCLFEVCFGWSRRHAKNAMLISDVLFANRQLCGIYRRGNFASLGHGPGFIGSRSIGRRVDPLSCSCW